MNGDKEYKEMYEMYKGGATLQEVAEEYNITHQAVSKGFQRRGYETRGDRPSIELDGYNFSQKENGAWEKTSGDCELLHQYVWKKHKGEIPEGYAVKHKDKNRSNNNIENLELVSKDEWSKRVWYEHGVEGKYCSRCHKTEDEAEGLTVYTNEKKLDKKYYHCHSCANERSKKYYKTENGKKAVKRAVKKNINKYPKKATARNKLNYAVSQGKIKKPQKCSKCGEAEKRIEGHHEDYSKPLEVKWVCTKCHSSLHD